MYIYIYVYIYIYIYIYINRINRTTMNLLLKVLRFFHDLLYYICIYIISYAMHNITDMLYIRISKTFSRSGYLCSEDGLVWL